MTQHVNAIYEHGVLKPLGPLDLHDQDLVALSIEKVPGNQSECSEGGPTLFELLDQAGLIGCVKDAPPERTQTESLKSLTAIRIRTSTLPMPH